MKEHLSHDDTFRDIVEKIVYIGYQLSWWGVAVDINRGWIADGRLIIIMFRCSELRMESNKGKVFLESVKTNIQVNRKVRHRIIRRAYYVWENGQTGINREGVVTRGDERIFVTTKVDVRVGVILYVQRT